MALLDYAALVDTVRELISGTGRTVVFGKLASDPDSPAEPWLPLQDDPSEVTAPATFVPLSSSTELGIKIADDELFRQAEQVCLVAPHATEDLSTYQLMTDGVETFRALWVYVLKPGDVVLLLAFGVKR